MPKLKSSAERELREKISTIILDKRRIQAQLEEDEKKRKDSK